MGGQSVVAIMARILGQLTDAELGELAVFEAGERPISFGSFLVMEASRRLIERNEGGEE